MMKSEKFTENSKKFYLIGFLFILIGIILNYMDYSTFDYSIIGIGILLVILGVNESIKSI